MVYCPECGTKNLKNAQFCEKCGSKLDITEKQPISGPSTKKPDQSAGKKPSGVIIVLGYIFAIFGGLIGIAIGAYLYTRKNPDAKFHGRNMLIIAAVIIVISLGATALLLNSYNNLSGKTSAQSTGGSNSGSGQISLSTGFPVSEVPGLAHEISKVGVDFSSITYSGVTLDKNQCLYILSRGIVMINNGETGNIPIGQYGNPESPYGTVTTVTITQTQYVDMAQRTYTWMDSNGISPNYIGITVSGEPDLSMDSVLNLYSKVLDQYESTGQLPASVTIA
jgi:hypothetical protein